MFHVKPAKCRPSMADTSMNRPIDSRATPAFLAWALVSAMAALMAALPVPEAQAAIHKCTGTDGKVTFSDQPCATGQGASVVKPVAPGPAPVVTGAPDASEKARAEARDRLRKGQTPECLNLADRMQNLLKDNAGKAPPADLDAVVNQYEQRCAARMRELLQAEAARNEQLAREQTRKSECDAKRRVLDERRPRLAQLSDSDKRAFAVVESEVARDCR
jgi:Domain of unknown function (DUF4124)